MAFMARIVRASPTVLQIALASLFFEKKLKNPSPIVWHIGLTSLGNWQESEQLAHICAHRGAAHPLGIGLSRGALHCLAGFFVRLADLFVS
jgi:hypothetical protein